MCKFPVTVTASSKKVRILKMDSLLCFKNIQLLLFHAIVSSLLLSFLKNFEEIVLYTYFISYISQARVLVNARKNSKTELLKSKLLLYLYIQLEVVDLQITNYPWLKLVLFFAAGFYLSTRLNFQSEVLSCFALNFFFSFMLGFFLA